MVRFAFAFLLASATAAPAFTAPPPLLSFESVEARDGRIVAHVVLLGADGPAVASDTLTMTLRAGGQVLPVELRRDGDGETGQGWLRVSYSAPAPAGLAGQAVLSLHGQADGYAFALAPGTFARSAGDAYAVASPQRGATSAGRNPIAPAPAPQPSFAAAAPATVSRDNPLLANLAAYKPIYGVFGASHTTGGRIQVSLQYQLFGDARAPTGNWKEGIQFGYTQRMLWDVRRYSAPFHDVSYNPELFYAVTGATTAAGVRFAGQAGITHESNGRGGDASRGYQTVYVQPTITAPLGRYTLEVAPRFYQYVFGRDRNPDIGRYRGHQSLGLAIGTPEGWKLSTSTRFNFGSGRGAAEAELSYPLARLLGVPVYAMLEGFTGYGESLLDYDRKGSRLRLGLGLVR